MNFSLGHDCCTMWRVARIIPAATIQWQSIKFLQKSVFCTGRRMLWRISFLWTNLPSKWQIFNRSERMNDTGYC